MLLINDLRIIEVLADEHLDCIHLWPLVRNVDNGCIPKICHPDLSGLGKLIEFLQVVKLGKRLYRLAGQAGHIVDEGIPASGEQLGAQEQETLGHALSPERSRGFEPQIDYTADGAFHGTTAT